METLKVCSRCKQEKPVTEFYVGRFRNRERISSYCKACISQKGKLYRQSHKEELQKKNREYCNSEQGKQYGREYRDKNKDRRSALSKEYYQKHKDKCIASARRWQAEHPDYSKTWQASNHDRRYSKYISYIENYYQEHRDRFIEQGRVWRKTNPHKVKALNNKRRAREQEATGADYTTDAMIAARWDYFGGTCWVCGGPAEAIDHVKPLKKGGAHLPCNLRPICKRCNSKKSAKWPYDRAWRSSGVITEAT